MAKLEWDKIQERIFEAGVERGVLYPLDGPGVPWNGLVAINEKTSREIKSYYLDGVKYLDHFVPGAYAAQIQAFTYPDVLDGILGACVCMISELGCFIWLIARLSEIL
jgi:hypothetical protein